MSRDAGSIPAASTDAGVTTRLKLKMARQFILASLSFLSHVSRVLALWHLRGCDRRRTHPSPNRPQKGSNGPKGSKSRDTPPSCPVTETSQKHGRNELAKNGVLCRNASSNMAKNLCPVGNAKGLRKLFHSFSLSSKIFLDRGGGYNARVLGSMPSASSSPVTLFLSPPCLEIDRKCLIYRQDE